MAEPVEIPQITVEQVRGEINAFLNPHCPKAEYLESEDFNPTALQRLSLTWQLHESGKDDGKFLQQLEKEIQALQQLCDSMLEHIVPEQDILEPVGEQLALYEEWYSALSVVDLKPELTQ